MIHYALKTSKWISLNREKKKKKNFSLQYACKLDFPLCTYSPNKNMQTSATVKKHPPALNQTWHAVSSSTALKTCQFCYLENLENLKHTSKSLTRQKNRFAINCRMGHIKWKNTQRKQPQYTDEIINRMKTKSGLAAHQTTLLSAKSISLIKTN